MNKFTAFFVAIGKWFKNVGIAIGKWFKNWFVPVDGKAIIPVRIGRWFKSLFVKTDEVDEPRLKTLLKKDGVKSFVATLMSIFIGIFIGFLIMLYKPSNAFVGLKYLLLGSFSNAPKTIGDALFDATPLIMTGLSVAFAYKVGLFNIGAPGQYLMGTLFSLLVALNFHGPVWLVWVCAVLAGAVGGALWGAIPGLFKAFLNINEVIASIMCNWIAINFVAWIFSGSSMTNPSINSYVQKPIDVTGVTNPKLGLDKIFVGSQKIDCTILIAIAIAIIAYIIMNKTTFGFELQATGKNKFAAKYAGIKDKRNIALSMIIAGSFAGLGAAMYWLSNQNAYQWQNTSSLPAVGFNGIPVALLASSNPIGVILSAYFIAHINIGGFYVTSNTVYNEKITDIIVAVVVYLSAFSMLFKGQITKWMTPKTNTKQIVEVIDVNDSADDGEESK